MLDVKWVVDHVDELRAAMLARHADIDVDQIVALNDARKSLVRRYDEDRNEQRQLSEMFKRSDVSAEDKAKARDTLRGVSDRLKAIETERSEAEEQLRTALLYVPNVPHESVPVGRTEADNTVVHQWGEAVEPAFEMQDHVDVGTRLGLLDFDAAASISGARFAVYRGLGARLERALMSFMLDLHTEQHGYQEVFAPYLVLPECMEGTSQLPKFADDAFRVDSGHYLIPTAEVPVTNLTRGRILEPSDVPMKSVAYSSCFRKEAGSYGKDTRGLTRLHQFQKVELVQLVEPHKSFEALEELTRAAEAVLEKLGLTYRRVTLCTGDLGFASTKTYDLEVWLPAQNTWREISSCSNFLDFQARRASLRYRPEPGAKPAFVHTLNGSGLAIGRTWMSVVENYQQPDGSVLIPEVLRPYMGGLEAIRPA